MNTRNTLFSNHKPSRFWDPWLQETESPRLKLIPVRNQGTLSAAFDQVSDPDTARAMGFPSPLTRLAFEKGCYRLPRKNLFLLQEKTSGQWVGLVTFWQCEQRPSWLEIMYCIQPAFRGSGFALEGSRALLAQLARHHACEGILASVHCANRQSLEVVKALGMLPSGGYPHTKWMLRMDRFRVALPDRLWPLVDWNRVPGTVRNFAMRLYGTLAHSGV
jgi:RimJ/RimL family protein N-acetyltransferase